MPPFNDLRFENRAANGWMQLFLLLLAVTTLLGHRFELWVAAVLYAVMLVGNLVSWWVPYLTGWPKAVIETNVQRGWTPFPVRADRVTPDALHTILGLLIVLGLVANLLALAKS
ncbi:hypothetical protein [Crossiella sp. NPDC003009]